MSFDDWEGGSRKGSGRRFLNLVGNCTSHAVAVAEPDLRPHRPRVDHQVMDAVDQLRSPVAPSTGQVTHQQPQTRLSVVDSATERHPILVHQFLIYGNISFHQIKKTVCRK